MIVVNAILESSEADIAALENAIAAMERASRAEAGCLDYTFAVELNRPGFLRITERWESIEALQRHFAAPHMAEFQKALAGHPLQSAKAYFYQATEIDVGR